MQNLYEFSENTNHTSIDILPGANCFATDFTKHYIFVSSDTVSVSIYFYSKVLFLNFTFIFLIALFIYSIFIYFEEYFQIFKLPR